MAANLGRGQKTWGPASWYPLSSTKDPRLSIWQRTAAPDCWTESLNTPATVLGCWTDISGTAHILLLMSLQAWVSDCLSDFIFYTNPPSSPTRFPMDIWYNVLTVLPKAAEKTGQTILQLSFLLHDTHTVIMCSAPWILFRQRIIPPFLHVPFQRNPFFP